MIYGYVRAITRRQVELNIVEEQIGEITSRYSRALVYEEQYKEKAVDRPNFERLISKVKEGDILVVTRLDILDLSIKNIVNIMDELLRKSVKIHILNIGVIDFSITGKVIINTLNALLEFDKSKKLYKIENSKSAARKNPGYKEGRPPKFTADQIEAALKKLNVNGGEYSYKAVELLSGISKRTLIRENNKRKMQMDYIK